MKFSIVTLLVSIATLLAWYYTEQSLIGIDDANIYMVYMRNFANNHGFVYNIGDERVEGFTSLLWTLIGAFYYSFFSKPEICLLLTNIFVVSFALWKLVRFLDEHFDDKKFISLPSMLLLAGIFILPGYIEWTVLSLLETGLWSALLLLISLNIIKSKEGFKHELEFHTLILLLILCRPESLLWAPFFCFQKALKYFLQERSLQKSLKVFLFPFLTFLFSASLLMLWRNYYFGFPFPNTYYAKVSSDVIGNCLNGAIYIYKGILYYPFMLFIFIFCCMPIVFKNLLSKENLLKHFALIFCLSTFFITLLICLYTGGDHFKLFRFIQPSMPFILLCAILFPISFPQIKFKKYYLGFVILYLLVHPNSKFFNTILKRSNVEYEYTLSITGRKTAKTLNEFFQANSQYPSLGVIPAGGFAYGYSGKTVDLLGLNNVEMAHAKKSTDFVHKNHNSFNKEVFFKQKPDILWFYANIIGNDSLVQENSLLVKNTFENHILRGVHLAASFKDVYKPVIISNKNLTYSIKLFSSKKFIESLDTNSYTIVTIPMSLP